MAKAVSPTALSTSNVTMRVRKSPSGGRPPPPPPPTMTCPAGPMDAPGLPPLPKSLSGLLNANSGTWRETLRIQTHKNMIQDGLASGAGAGPPGQTDGGCTSISSSSSSSSSSCSSSSAPPVAGATSPAAGVVAGRCPPPKRRKMRKVSVPQGNLDGALAMLRKEMVGLRQLDMSLLSQLWSLHESIQEYKVVVETMSCMSDRDSADFDSEDLQSLSPLSPGILSPTSMV